MVFRKFHRNFENVVSLDDCDCAAKASARQLADGQAGVWNVWFYEPRSQAELDQDSANEETPILRIFPEVDFSEDVLSGFQNDASVTRF